MVELADTIALGAIGATLGGSNPLPPNNFPAPNADWSCVGAHYVMRE